MSQHGVPHLRMSEIGRIWIVRGLNWTFSYVRDEIEPNTIVHGRIRLFYLPLTTSLHFWVRSRSQGTTPAADRRVNRPTGRVIEPERQGGKESDAQTR